MRSDLDLVSIGRKWNNRNKQFQLFPSLFFTLLLTNWIWKANVELVLNSKFSNLDLRGEAPNTIEIRQTPQSLHHHIVKTTYQFTIYGS